MTIQQAFDLAVHHHQAGRLNEAESIYRQILAVESRHADALHHLGLIAHQVGRNDIAVDMIRQAIALQPADHSAYSNLGLVLKAMGQPEEAIAAYRQAISLHPGFSLAHYNLGIAMKDMGLLTEAIASYRQAIIFQPEYSEAHCNLGLALYDKGLHEDAITAFRQAIIFRPSYPEAYNNLGTVLKDKGQLDEAVAACRQAIILRPAYPEAYYNLGNALKDKGLLDEAIAALRQAIALQQDFPEAHNILGAALREKGLFDEAIAAYRQALILQPDYPEAHNNIGVVLQENGRPDEAIAAFRQALALQSDYAEAHNNLGAALQGKGRPDEAIAAYRQALTLRPDYPEAHNNIGVVLQEKGLSDEAIDAYQQAISLLPAFPKAHMNLGNALRDKGLLHESIAAYRQALAFKPDYPEAYINLGNALKDQGRLGQAIANYRQAIALEPYIPEANNNLGTALQAIGQLDESISFYRQALTLKSDYSDAHSNLVFCMNYHPEFEASEIADEHGRWNRKHSEPLRQFIRTHANDRSPNRRLRVGYVSPDFRSHPVAYFLEGLLEHHDSEQVEVFCYANVTNPDAVTARIQKLAGHWHRITGLPDMEVAELISNDGIDILVDLAGHTGKNRLPVFGRKPAPVQVTWLGYSNKTWLDTIDYRLTDAFADPPENVDELLGEQLVRLPKTFACFRPAESAPPVGPQPAACSGRVTFASFHTLAKLNEALLECWVQILNNISGSRLMLVAAGLDELSIKERFSGFFTRRGIDAERLEYKGHQTLEGYLELHHEVDLLLDSHPFSGHTVSCHALWMGVPVVTLAGKTHCSRMVASVLSNLDLSELIARSPEQYIQLAVQLANDLPRMTELRSTLRERMQASPLMDAAGFARDIEAAYREMWRIWYEQPEPQPCPK